MPLHADSPTAAFIFYRFNNAVVVGIFPSDRPITIAHTADQAVEKTEQEEFDLVISDIGLPDRSGFDLMKELSTTKGLRGIALSGFGMDDDRAASAAAGFAEHLTKPIDWPQLRSAIERLLARHNETSPAPAAVS